MKVFGMLACVLCVGQAFISAVSAQAPAKAAGSNPIVSISTGQLRARLHGFHGCGLGGQRRSSAASL